MSEKNRKILVTGGVQGIGLGITKLLLENGDRVIAADIDREAGEEATQQFNSDNFRFIPADVSREESVNRFFKTIGDDFGSLDALINNAAIADPYNTPVEEMTLEEWDQTIRTNLTSVFLCSRGAVSLLRKSGMGCIVNMASTRAFMSEPNTEGYSAAKGGVVALTHALANSLGPEIRVNAISPGWIEVRDWKKSSDREEPHHRDIDREQHPVGRVGNPMDIARLVKYLISEESGFVTGQNFTVDGGMTRKMIYAH